MNYSFKIIPLSQGEESWQHPFNITFSKEFASWKEKQSGLASGFLEVHHGGHLLAVLPVSYSDSDLYCVYKGYTEPKRFELGDLFWPKIARDLRRNLKLKFVELTIAGVQFEEKNSNGYLSTYVFDFKGRTPDFILNACDKKTRNQIKKSQKFNFRSSIAGYEHFQNFYDLYKRNMARHGTPPKSQDYFRELFDSFGQNCEIIEAWSGDELAGSNLVISGGEEMKLLQNISEPEFWPECVNDFLYFEMLKLAAGRGLARVDFEGGLDSDRSHAGFKLGFGARKIPIRRYRSGALMRGVKLWFLTKRRNLRLRYGK